MIRPGENGKAALIISVGQGLPASFARLLSGRLPHRPGSAQGGAGSGLR